MWSDLSAHTEQRDYPDIENRHFSLVGYMPQVVPESGILGVMKEQGISKKNCVQVSSFNTYSGGLI